MPPTFSIIIPVYNVAHYLAECLDSVRAQTYADWEARCVDDGSTDASAPLLDTYARLDPRIHITHQRNAGVSSARNRALTTAPGEWICFLDGDDVVLNNWLFVLNKTIVEEEPSIVRIRYLLWDGRKMIINSDELRFRKTVYSDEAQILRWGSRVFYREGFVCLVCYRKEMVIDRRFAKDVQMKEDCLYNFSLLQRLKKVCQLEYQGYLYRQRVGSAVFKMWPVESRLELVKECLDVWQCMRETVARSNLQLLYRFVFCLISREIEEAYRARQGACLLGKQYCSTLRKWGFYDRWLQLEKIGSNDFRLADRLFAIFVGG